MNTHVMEPTKCPCGKKTFDRASQTHGQDEGPKPGDVTVCLYCCEPLQFGDNMEMQKVDMNTLPQEIQMNLVEVMRGIMETINKKFP